MTVCLAVSTGALIAILAGIILILVAGMVYWCYCTISQKIYVKTFKRPRPMPQVDRSPKEIEDRQTVIGRGRNWFYANRMQFLNVSVRSFDGTVLSGYFRPSADPTCRNVVILLHGYDEHPSMMGAYAKLLMREIQCHVIIAHQRAHCMSGGKYYTYGLMESVDLDSWFDYAKRRVGPDCRIYLMGRSMGATTALLAAQQEGFCENVAGIIADSPAETLTAVMKTAGKVKYGRNIERYIPRVRKITQKRLGFDINRCDCAIHAGRIKVPVLIFQGGEDDITLPSDTKHIFDNLRCLKKMVVIDAAKHVQCYNKAPALYEKEVRKFIEQCVVRLVKLGRL